MIATSFMMMLTAFGAFGSGERGGLIQCYLQGIESAPTADRPGNLKTVGLMQYLLFKIPVPDGPRIPGSEVTVHDPNGLLKGRSIDHIVFSDDGIGIMTAGPEDESIALVIQEMKPGGEPMTDATLVRISGDNNPELLIGKCAGVNSSDIDKAFETAKAQASTVQ